MMDEEMYISAKQRHFYRQLYASLCYIFIFLCCDGRKHYVFGLMIPG